MQKPLHVAVITLVCVIYLFLSQLGSFVIGFEDIIIQNRGHDLGADLLHHVPSDACLRCWHCVDYPEAALIVCQRSHKPAWLWLILHDHSISHLYSESRSV